MVQSNYTSQAIFLHKKLLTTGRAVCDYSSSALRCVARIGRNKMYYVNTYHGFIPDRSVVPKPQELVIDVLYAAGFFAFAEEYQASKEALKSNSRQVQYYAVLG